MDRFFITTPIYYVNARPHLGHAYTTIVADSLNRFHRLMGEETFFLTGTDEHGDKIVKAAAASGQTPQQYTDEISGLFRNLWPKLGVENTSFIRTTEPRHKQLVQKILQLVYDKGDIYLDEYGGHYCFGCERFLTEKELENGLCPDHKTAPEYIAEKNYFFRMSKYQGWLLEHIKANPDFIRPDRYRNEVVSLLESEALGDLCISRPKSRLTWGIELPFDHDYVTYVWFDALINYITALEWPDGENFRAFWPAANHLVAKDILKPHAVFWPTMLKAAGIEPYQHLNVHGYWLIKDTKMSKSLGNVVEPLDMVDRYGLSAFRYFLLREMTFGQDASFSEEALVGRLNADLANDLGNLWSRVLTMTHKYFGGQVPPKPAIGPDNEDIVALGKNAIENFQTLFGRLQFSRALESLWELVRGLNRYIDQMAPWTLFKNKETDRLGTVIYTILEEMRRVALHVWPVMPQSSEAMLSQLGLSLDPASTDLRREIGQWGLLPSGTAIAPSSNLFPRVELKAEAPAAKPEPAAKPSAKPAPAKPAEAAGPKAEIEFEDFQKLDMRIGRIKTADRVPKADKLLLLTVDLGEPEPRQIVSGIAEHFSPEDLPGREVVVLVNLKPRKLRGVMSQGMILAVKGEHGLKLLAPGGEANPGDPVS